MERLRGHKEGGEGEGEEDASDEISAEGNAQGEGEGKGEGGPTTAASAGSEAEETAGQGRSCISEEEVVNKIMLEPMPKKQFISLEELGETAAFLMSSAARNITGQTMILDGGWTAR